MRDEILDAAQELLSRMTMPELFELVKLAVDDMTLRTMQTAGDEEDFGS